MKLILRGHHLLCLQGFQGYGYDSDFVKNMTEVNEIRKIETTEITVCDSPDDICKACPNLKNNMCQSNDENDNIVKMDRKVLERLPKKEFETSKELFDLLNATFHSKSSVKGICDGCKWTEECLFVQNLENR